jgi:hypothetical protein
MDALAPQLQQGNQGILGAIVAKGEHIHRKGMFLAPGC